MYSLLYKDWSIIRKSRALFFGLFYFLFIGSTATRGGVFSNNNVTTFMFLFVIYLFFSYITAYDYKYNGLTLMSAFPVRKRTIVQARYLFIALVFFAAFALVIAMNLIAILVKHDTLGFSAVFDYSRFAVLFFVFSFFFGIVIPLYYKLGYQKIRWVMFVAVIISSAIAGLLTAEISVFTHPSMALTVIIAGAIVYWLSLQLSVRFLEQRDL